MGKEVEDTRKQVQDKLREGQNESVTKRILITDDPSSMPHYLSEELTARFNAFQRGMESTPCRVCACTIGLRLPCLAVWRAHADNRGTSGGSSL